ncbi:MAG: hypothetical protein GX093_02240 [Xanthomonadaceae bacterium]|nr:hypothetical protein [Xanthomonadaceae bacterium]
MWRASRLLAAALAYAVTLVAVAVAAILAVLILAGPHGGLLPSWTKPFVLALGWLAVLILPAWLVRWVWGRLQQS